MVKHFPELMMENNQYSIPCGIKTSKSLVGLNKEWKKRNTITHLSEASENQGKRVDLKKQPEI